MTKEELKDLALTADEKAWPAIRDKYLRSQTAKSVEQRLRELEGAQLLLSIGFLRLERAVDGLADFATKAKSKLGAWL